MRPPSYAKYIWLSKCLGSQVKPSLWMLRSTRLTVVIIQGQDETSWGIFFQHYCSIDLMIDVLLLLTVTVYIKGNRRQSSAGFLRSHHILLFGSSV